jgi:hypothetical protein
VRAEHAHTTCPALRAASPCTAMKWRGWTTAGEGGARTHHVPSAVSVPSSESNAPSSESSVPVYSDEKVANRAEGFGMCLSFKDHFLSRCAKP